MAAPVFRQPRQRPVRSEVFSLQLIPGIPDDIILDNVTPKLSWRDLYTLSSVSLAWRQSNRSRQVYEARVRSHETETLAVVNYSPCHETIALALESTKGFGGANRWELPPIPGFKRGIPLLCGCVTLDGKVYILGGESDSIGEDGKGKVYVMDLAGQTGWKRCASMGEARLAFACCAKDGKIYVFGGEFGNTPLRSSEVYDPNEDKWSPITPMPTLRYLFTIRFLGNKLVWRRETRLLCGEGFISSSKEISIETPFMFEGDCQTIQFNVPVEL